jgi:two-component system OmpR family sensor kinase
VTSLRRAILAWITALLALVGVVAFVVSYELAKRDAADFFDGQLRQIALNAGDGMVEADAPPVAHDPEDEFVITIWNAAGEVSRVSRVAGAPPRLAKPGFATVRANGED